MSARANNPWVPQSSSHRGRPAVCPAMEVIAMRERLAIVRDTLIVLGMQLAFRTTHIAASFELLAA